MRLPVPSERGLKLLVTRDAVTGLGVAMTTMIRKNTGIGAASKTDVARSGPASLWVFINELALAQAYLPAHDRQNEDSLPVAATEHAARRSARRRSAQTASDAPKSPGGDC